MRFARWWMALALVAALAGCATGGKKMDTLQRAQYDYSAAIRWNDFEGAWSMVDPDYRKEHPKTNLEFERYKQIQVAGYTDLASQVSADDLAARREIQISVINRHDMSERSIRYTEVWRYDPEAEAWWITSGLPDFWAGM